MEQIEFPYKEWLRNRRISRIKRSKNKDNMIEKLAIKTMQNIGSVKSVMIHTVLFALPFILIMLGSDSTTVLLVFTTMLSLEAIYLSIFIQMGVNLQAKKLQSVASDVGALQKDVDEISDNVEGISDSVEEISDNVEEIQEDIQEDEDEEEEDDEAIKQIKATLDVLMEEVLKLKKNIEEDDEDDENIKQIKSDIGKVMKEIRKIDSKNKRNNQNQEI